MVVSLVVFAARWACKLTKTGHHFHLSYEPSAGRMGLVWPHGIERGAYSDKGVRAAVPSTRLRVFPAVLRQRWATS